MLRPARLCPYFGTRWSCHSLRCARCWGGAARAKWLDRSNLPVAVRLAVLKLPSGLLTTRLGRFEDVGRVPRYLRRIGERLKRRRLLCTWYSAVEVGDCNTLHSHQIVLTARATDMHVVGELAEHSAALLFPETRGPRQVRMTPFDSAFNAFRYAVGLLHHGHLPDQLPITW